MQLAVHLRLLHPVALRDLDGLFELEKSLGDVADLLAEPDEEEDLLDFERLFEAILLVEDPELGLALICLLEVLLKDESLDLEEPDLGDENRLLLLLEDAGDEVGQVIGGVDLAAEVSEKGLHVNRGLEAGHEEKRRQNEIVLD